MDVHLSSLFQANQYAFHALIVGVVIISALLVYVFGFKRPVEPPFDKLTNPHEDRKSNGKKRKTKDKKSQSNGHVTGISESRKEVKQVAKKDVEKSPIKDKKADKKQALKENRDVKPVAPSPDNNKKKGKGKENVEVKNKKNKAADEKPKDFDDGEWEQAPSRKDKKNKKSTLDEILSTKIDKKKDNKKKKDDLNEQKDEEAAASATPVTTDIYTPQESSDETAQQKPEVGVESDPEQLEDPKPKRGRKKRGVSGGESSTTVEEKPTQQPAEVSKPSPSVKPKKEPPPEPTPAPKSEPAATDMQSAETTVVFDELGDTWKEARAPKKGGKKKSRKE